MQQLPRHRVPEETQLADMETLRGFLVAERRGFSSDDFGRERCLEVEQIDWTLDRLELPEEFAAALLESTLGSARTRHRPNTCSV